jgi:hypothetical protein
MKNISITTLLLGALAVLAAAGARGQDPAQYSDIRQTVARISYVSGDVSYNRGDEPDVWQDAVVNVPMTLGDRLYVRGDGRAELQLQGGNFVRVGAQSDLSVLNLIDDVDQFSLQAGTASFRLPRLGSQESFEVDTPNVAVTFEQAGDYRLDVDQGGNTRVTVRSGRALVAAGGGQIQVSAGSVMIITGLESPQYDIVALPGFDAWDRWVDQRDLRSRRIRSSVYVNAGVVGVEDLDQFGRWSNIPRYGHVWSPLSVQVGWQPYRAGRWGWQDPWGWTWIADEPWGWAPYHYGRWVTYSSRWYWVPVAPSAGYASYSPALVGFVGGGPGWSVSFSIGGGGYLGWFPLAPLDPFVPWWGPRAGINVGFHSGNYANRRYLTVVNRNTFVSGGGVAGNYVRDPSVLRQVVAAPVIRGVLPVLPTAGALRVSRTAGAAARPPLQVNSRPVVTRLAPPPAPPTFQSKVAAIRERRGAPVTAAEAAQISIRDNQGARALHPVRPAAAPSGAVTLRERSAKAAAPRPQPVTAPRGKALATADRPIVSTPAAAARPEARPPAPIAPNAVAAPGVRGAPPPKRSSEPPPQRVQPEPSAPRGQSAQPPDRQKQLNAPPPKRPSEPPPQRVQPEPSAPRGQSAQPPDRQKQLNAPPPKRPSEPPPQRVQPQPRGSESRPPTQVNRTAPPPQRPAASRGDKSKSQKTPDAKKKKGEPTTSTEAPPKTQ